jgi:ribonucleoside-diphosphate reductase alpha chain
MLLMNSYTIPNHPPVAFDYSLIRPAGQPIKVFGGTSSGYEPLARLHKLVRAFFECYLDIHTGDTTTGRLVDPWTAVKEMIRKTEDSKTYTSICTKLDLQKNFCDRLSQRDTTLTIEELKKRTDFYYIDKIYKQKYHRSLDDISSSTTARKNSEELHSKTIFSFLENKDITYLFNYSTKTYDHVRLVADIFNAIGCCVVAGNVRRSSEIALGSPDSNTFYNLKNYDINPERFPVGWMSNNTVVLKETKDFKHLPTLTQRMKQNGEPGICNLINVKYGRIGRNKHVGREDELDKATGLNPCGEIGLESFELCNLAEVFPTRCESPEDIMKACEYAITYTSNNSLARTHWGITNEVIARNRRNGVSFSGISELYETTDMMDLIRILRDAYDLIRETNARLNSEAGVPAAIRVTTIKPSGSISQLAGVNSGIHFPIYRYAMRSIRVDKRNPIVPLLIEAGYSYEEDLRTPNTWVFYFPIFCGSGRTAKEVDMREQAMLSMLFQREYVDNSISQTIYFDPKTEGASLEKCLAMIAPQIKTISVFPREEEQVETKENKQNPYTKITEEKYLELKKKLKPIDWSKYKTEVEPEMPSGCSNDTCEFKPRAKVAKEEKKQ